MTWAADADVTHYVGDTDFSGYTISDYIDIASDEIHTHLVQFWVLPIPATIHDVHTETLKNIEARIAAAHLLLAATSSMSDDHTYAMFLLKEARENLYAIDYDLTGSPGAVRNSITPASQAPSIGGGDSVSPSDTFHSFAYGTSTTGLDYS